MRNNNNLMDRNFSDAEKRKVVCSEAGSGHAVANLKCLIVRSGREALLSDTIALVSDKYSSIDVISDKTFNDKRIIKTYENLIIEQYVVYSTDVSLRQVKYDDVIILLDLKRYSPFSYDKFIRFVKNDINYKNILFYDGVCFQSYFKFTCKIYFKSFSFRSSLKKIHYHLVGFILFFILSLIKPIKKICFLVFNNASRIGHLAANTDVFLRRKSLFRDNSIYFGVIGKDVMIANSQLLKMIKRKIFIVKSELLYVILHNSILFRSEYFKDLMCCYFKSSIEYYEFDNVNSKIEFTKEEGEKGAQLLKKMGIDSWFVCFHARDSLYLKSTFPDKNLSYHDFRDFDIETMIPAMEYISKQGGYALRVGSVVEKPLMEYGNPRIIDYATKYRSDFMDIYLASKCKFFVGCNAGLFLVYRLFNKPVVTVNNIPFMHLGVSKDELWIPKKLWNNERNEYLSYREIYSSDYALSLHSHEYENRKLVPVNNSPDEILKVVIEMNNRCDNKINYSEKEQELQKTFVNITKLNKYYYNSPTRIGSDFLKDNIDLIHEKIINIQSR
ncbi:MAG: hypothetical protein ACD_79C00287G0014 [uncultured bacterium]|nr:MAG: hypothetical protein ACD_79C00287G0014 [uncultured bacterium]